MKTGIVLMTYGSAVTAENIEPYFKHIYAGRELSPEVVAEYARRYKVIGRSPLIENTERQAAALEEALGKNYVVRAGMRHSKPFIADAVAQCAAAGASELIGIILAPQQSAFIRSGYEKDLLEAAAKHNIPAHLSAPWPAEPHFMRFLAGEIKKFPELPVIFTTHSLPKRVVENEPEYGEQLAATALAVRKELPADIEWYAAYQSAGHTPEEWLKPDLTEILDELKQKNSKGALIVPIQFVCDHLEVLYDLDVATRAQCEERGFTYLRTAMPGTDPLFIEALAAIARRKI